MARYRYSFLLSQLLAISRYWLISKRRPRNISLAFQASSVRPVFPGSSRSTPSLPMRLIHAALVVANDIHPEAGLDLAEKGGLGIELRADLAFDAGQAAARQEAALADEAAADRVEASRQVQVARRLGVVGVQRHPPLVRHGEGVGKGGEAVEAEHLRARKPELSVEPDQAVGVAALLAPGVESPQEAVPAQGALVAENGEGRVRRPGRRRAGGCPRPRRWRRWPPGCCGRPACPTA